MSPYYLIMPVDKSTIRTLSAFNPDFLADPAAFIRKHNLPVRSSKPTRGKCEYGPTWNLTLALLNHKGIKLKMRQIAGDPLVNVTIEFNPGVCLYAHNGHILLLTEFLDALALLATNIRPLLRDQDDWLDLVPGLRVGGVAYWGFLEVPFHYRDPGGALLARLRNVRLCAKLGGPNDGTKTKQHRYAIINTPSRHWPDSMEVGGKRSKLQLVIYRKAVEMATRHIDGDSLLSDEELAAYKDVLRLEARMKGKKLVRYFGNGHNIEVIDGKERLVWFFPEDLIRGHRACYTELEGVFSSGEFTEVSGKTTPRAALAQMLANVADDPRSRYKLPQLIATTRHYTGASGETISAVRSLGMAELSRRSCFSSADLFSDAAYASQVSIISRKAEGLVRHEHIDAEVLRVIAKRYRPEGQPFHPHIELPSHCR
jgi:hypothetical protein